MKKLLFMLIEDAIKNEFWRSESGLVEQYFNLYGEQLDCDGITIEYHAADTLRITIGPVQYAVQITSNEEGAR